MSKSASALRENDAANAKVKGKSIAADPKAPHAEPKSILHHSKVKKKK